MTIVKRVTVAVIGGDRAAMIIQKGKEVGIDFLVHDGRNPRQRDIYSLTKKADAVIVMNRFCGHNAMDHTKESCKQLGKRIVFLRERGISSLLASANQFIS